jgi:hypothetical protein
MISPEAWVAGFGSPRRGNEIAFPTNGGWRDFVSTLGRERLSGLALEAVEDGALPMPAEHVPGLIERQRGAMYQVLRLESRLILVTKMFRDAGIDSIVLKGSAVAHSFYPDPSQRLFGDVDVLVRGRDLEDAVAILQALGYRRRFPEPRPGFSRRFGHTVLHVDPEGCEVDLHRTLVGGPFGLRIEPESLFESSVPFILADRHLRRLDDTAAFLHACLHASLGHHPPQLVSLRDVVQIAQRGEVDWERLSDRTRRGGCGAVVSHAITATERTLGVQLPDAGGVFLRSVRPGFVERRLVRSGTEHRVGGTTVSSVWGVRGFREKAAYAKAVLVPDRRFLQSRGGSYLRRWLTPLRRSVRRRSRS